MLRWTTPVLLALLAPAYSGQPFDRSPTHGAAEFVAVASDFSELLQWPHVDLGVIAVGGHPEGHRHVYANRMLHSSERRYPIGSIVVKVVERGHSMRDWDVVAMVKRGGGFNSEGAVDWEFFVLVIERSGRVRIAGRGEQPQSDHPDEYLAGDVGCNDCHGTRDARELDGMLSLQMRPAGSR